MLAVGSAPADGGAGVFPDDPLRAEVDEGPVIEQDVVLAEPLDRGPRGARWSPGRRR